MENYTITKEQILAIEKVGGADVSLYLKETFPEVFKTELEVGKWYKHIRYGYFFCFNGQYDDNSQYGIANSGEWTTCLSSSNRHIDSFRLATDEEVSAALINEAKKRGFKSGVKVVGLYNDGRPHQITDFIINKDDFTYKTLDNALVCNKLGFRIFANGKWAEILYQEKTVIPMEKALKIIAKKMKVSPENIEIQS